MKATIEGVSIQIAHATRWAAAVELIPAGVGDSQCDHDHIGIDQMKCRLDSDLFQRLLFLAKTEQPTKFVLRHEGKDILSGAVTVDELASLGSELVTMFLTLTDADVADTAPDTMFALSDRMEEVEAAHGDWRCGGPKMTQADSLAVLMREVGEVAEAIRIGNEEDAEHNTNERLKDELLDVAAAALWWAGSLDTKP